MPAELPYLVSYKNVEKLFRSIASAKRPETFTTRFLADTLGLKSATDRPLVALLRTLGFLDAAGKPTPEYDALKNPERAPYAIGDAIRRAYSSLFAANEKANELSSEQLRGLISQVAGTDENMTKRVGWTLGALLKIAKFGDAPAGGPGGAPDDSDDGKKGEGEDLKQPLTRLRPEFHYNIQIHLPANGTEETYISIFEAVRKVFR